MLKALTTAMALALATSTHAEEFMASPDLAMLIVLNNYMLERCPTKVEIQKSLRSLVAEAKSVLWSIDSAHAISNIAGVQAIIDTTLVNQPYFCAIAVRDASAAYQRLHTHGYLP
jgi:hypothetical protein